MAESVIREMWVLLCLVLFVWFFFLKSMQVISFVVVILIPVKTKSAERRH